MDSSDDREFGPFRLNPAARTLWRGAVAVPLRPKLFAALQYLVEHAGRLITREELLRAVWSRTHVDETLLRGTMRDLRAALGDDAEAPRFIETIPHQGYRFLAAVRRKAASGAHAGMPTSASHQADSLLEREPERAQLGRCLDRALDRQRRIVFVTGEPGIGKTALVDLFVEGLPNRHGVVVGRGQCVEQYGVGEAYLPVLEAVRQMCRGRASKRVIATLQQHAPTWLVQLPALLTDSEFDALQRKTQGAARDRMLREMAEALEALSVEMPVALVFEDLQWSDYSTLDLLGVLARRREPARLLVLGTYRPADLIVTGHPLRALAQELRGRGLCEEVPLGFLSEGATAAYLAERFGVTREDAGFRSLASRIHRRTDGNPLFMINVADDLVGRGAIAHGDGAWRVQVDAVQADTGVPEGLKPLIDRQLERAPVEDQRLLEAASVAGRVFSAEAVAAALESTADGIDELCEQLGRRGLFIEAAVGAASGHYTFRHDLYQRALYDRLSPSRRARLHRRIAEFEMRGAADQVRERAAQLAVHFERGGDHARAIEHLAQAATNALTRQASQEAIDLLRRALDLLALLPPSIARAASEEYAATLREKLADTLAVSGAHDEARTEFSRAFDALGPGRSVDAARLWRKIGKTLETTHDHAGALDAYARAEVELDAVGDSDRDAAWRAEWIQVRLNRIWVFYWQARITEMDAELEAVAPVVDAHGLPLQRSSYFQAIVTRNYRQDRYVISDATIGYARQSLVSAFEAGALTEAAFARFVLGFGLLFHGDLVEAEAELSEALQEARRLGDVTSQVRSMAYLVIRSRRAGNVDDTRTMARDTLLLASSIKMPDYIGVAHAGLGWVAWKRDDAEEARAECQAALDVWAQPSYVYPFQWTGALTMLAVQASRAPVPQLISIAERMLDVRQMQLPEPILTPLEASVAAFRAGDVDEAREGLVRVVKSAKRLQYL